MNWLNISLDVLDSEEFAGAEPAQQGNWLNLSRYCARQENGGRIRGASGWPAKKFERVLRVSKEDLTDDCDLWHWDGDDLTVCRYPAEHEEKARANRANGAKGGRPPKRKPVLEPDGEPTGNHMVSEPEPCGSETLNHAHNPNGKYKYKSKCNDEIKDISAPPEPPPVPGDGAEVPASPESELPHKEGKPPAYPPFIQEIWEMTPATGRNRSSRKKLDSAWKAARPKPEESVVLDALKAWCQSESWTTKEGQFVPGIHSWVSDRKWENPPAPKTATSNPKRFDSSYEIIPD